MMSSKQERKEELLAKCTHNQRRVLGFRLNSKSNKEAVIKAGLGGKNPDQVASKMFALANVRAAWEAMLDAWEEDEGLTRQEAIVLASGHARARLTDALDEAGNITVERLKSPEVAPHLEAIEEEVRFDGEGNRIITRKIKMVNKLAAIKTVSELKEWNKTRIEHSGAIEVIQMDDLPSRSGAVEHDPES